MTNNRLEILVNGIWERLDLDSNNVISYNKVINKVGDINTREISHTNTFNLPNSYRNRNILGLNVFNHLKLARALNSKYECRYFVQELLIQKGFLVINQAKDDDIKVNFFDSSLDLIDDWSRYTYRDLLNDGGLQTPQDYRDSIFEMQNYFVSRSGSLSSLRVNPTRGHHLALFPNNLNPIGDSFMIGDDDNRPENSFNPYQSRPIFNLKSLFDLACLSFGFTPVYDESVNWQQIEGTYFVSNGLSDNFTGEIDLNTSSIVLSAEASGNLVSSNRYIAVADDNESIPNNIPGWIDPEIGWNQSYRSLPVVYLPNLDQVGVTGVILSGPGTISDANCYAVWSNITSGGDVIHQSIQLSGVIQDNGDLALQITKSSLSNPPSGANQFLGIVFSFNALSEQDSYQFYEAELPIDSVEYDDFSQLQAGQINLTYAAPEETVKDLLINAMKIFGIIMNIDNEESKVTFFNYSRYDSLKAVDDFEDFSDYLQRHEPFNYNTDFGNEYARINKIGLSSPFKGNTRNISITNQDTRSKLKDYAENYSQKYKDVEFVQRINNSNEIYIEYTNSGLGLVFHTGFLEDLDQIYFRESDNDNGISPFVNNGTVSGLASIENFNMSIAISGIDNWYNIVDQAVKAEPTFLLPNSVMRDIDVTKPIYLDRLGGFYIIEEVSEYNNGQTPVRIKLIKLLSGAEFSDDFSNDFNI